MGIGPCVAICERAQAPVFRLSVPYHFCHNQESSRGAAEGAGSPLPNWCGRGSQAIKEPRRNISAGLSVNDLLPQGLTLETLKPGRSSTVRMTAPWIDGSSHDLEPLTCLRFCQTSARCHVLAKVTCLQGSWGGAWRSSVLLDVLHLENGWILAFSLLEHLYLSLFFI